MTVSESVKNLFDAYEDAFSRLDFQKIGEFLADTFILAGPSGTIARNKDEYMRFSEKAADFYRSVGQESAKILSINEDLISNEYSMVKVHWGVTFRKTGNRLIEFDVTYLVQKTSDKPLIILFVAHQDEQKAMQGFSLTSNLEHQR